MSKNRTQLARRVLLVLLVAVGAAVAWSLRKPALRSGPAAVTQGATGASAQDSTASDVVFRRFREGRLEIEVRARAQVGQEGSTMRLRGCQVMKPFVSEGRPATLTIAADDCDYTPQPQGAKLRGHVHVATSEDFELDTEQLDYAAQEGVARSEADVRFRRKGTSGTARGFEYRGEGGELQLQRDVRLLIQQEAGSPAEVEAGSLRSLRSERRVFLDGGVVVRQGARELRSQKLQLNMTADFGAVERASAIDDVDLRTGSGAAVPGAPVTAAGSGEKRLRCRKLVVEFREKGGLSQATAVNPATLDIQPGPRDQPEQRHIESDLIRFGFDDQGRLTSIEAQGGGPMARVTVLTAGPLPGRRGTSQRVECLNMNAALDAETGTVQRASFDQNVVFADAERKAWARQAEFREDEGLLTLTGQPRVVDEARGSELQARRIVMGTRSHTVSASDDVRNTIKRKGGAGAAAPLRADEPTVLLCRQFDFDSATKTARYLEHVVMRSGADEIRAPKIVIEEPAEGRRRLSASGGVVSTLHPRAEKGQSRTPAPVEARSREMVYGEKEQRVVYTGEVEIRQGDILTKSPEAVVVLTPDGTAMERLLAYTPVEVRQGTRRATGERGTYTPRDETLVLVGEKVVLQDADRRLEGRILTFQSGSDRIRVDGRDEVRSEAILKRKEPLKP